MRKLKNTKKGQYLMEIMHVVGDHIFNDLLHINEETGRFERIKSNSPEWVTMMNTLRSASKRAQKLVKDKSISLSQKIERLYNNFQNLTNEDMAVLAMLTEYRINLDFYGSECYFNWYEATDAGSVDNFSQFPRVDWKFYGSTGKRWGAYSYKTNPFDI